MTRLVYVAYDRKNVSNFEVFDTYEIAIQFRNAMERPSTWNIISKRLIDLDTWQPIRVGDGN